MQVMLANTNALLRAVWESTSRLTSSGRLSGWRGDCPCQGQWTCV